MLFFNRVENQGGTVMYIKPFAVEEWMNEYEDNARFNIAET